MFDWGNNNNMYICCNVHVYFYVYLCVYLFLVAQGPIKGGSVPNVIWKQTSSLIFKSDCLIVKRFSKFGWTTFLSFSWHIKVKVMSYPFISFKGQFNREIVNNHKFNSQVDQKRPPPLSCIQWFVILINYFRAISSWVISNRRHQREMWNVLWCENFRAILNYGCDQTWNVNVK